MWPWFYSLFFLVITSSSMHAGTYRPSEVGPSSSSPDEASFLWKEAQNDFHLARYGEAALKLERLIHRKVGLPTFSNYWDAHYLLGIVYYRMEEPKKALKPLRKYIEAKNFSDDGLRARIFIARSYLDTQQPHAALLSMTEAQDQPDFSVRLPREYQESLLIKAQAQLKLRQMSRVPLTLAAFQATLSGAKTDDVLLAEAFFLRNEVALHECSAISEKKSSDEGMIRQQVKNHGKCWIQALTQYYESLKHPEEPWALKSRLSIEKGFAHWRSRCTHPKLAPPKTAKGDEATRFRQELLAILAIDCAETRTEAQDLIKSWTDKANDRTRPHWVELSKTVNSV